MEPTTWTVGRQSHLTMPTAAGPVPGVNVPVILSDGAAFDVFVPDDVYRQGADAVRTVIQDQVNLHDSVARLTGTAGT